MGRKTSIYLNPQLDRLAHGSGEPLGEALHRGLSVTPLLIEDRGGLTWHWFCEVPPMGAKFTVLREHWRGTGEQPVREVYEVEVMRPMSPRSPRHITVEYRHDDGGWHASSPEITTMRHTAATLADVQAQVRHRLDEWLDPAVSITEKIWPD